MRATPQEIRAQIIAAKLRGEKIEIIKLWYGVSKRTINRIWSRYQETGNCLAKAHKGRKSQITPEMEGHIRAEIAANNDITLEELIEKLNLPIKKSQLSRLLISWGLTFKKRHFTPKSSNEKTSRKNGVIGVRNKKHLI